MGYMKKLYIPFLFVLFSLTSCQGEGEKLFSILSYNMYLFMDDVSDGDEIEPFRSSDGYGKNEFIERVELYSSLLQKDEFMSDLFLFQEIESAAVLYALAEKLYDKGYYYYGIADSGTPLSIGFLSRIKPDRVSEHRLSGSRTILELVFKLAGEYISVFTVHFRSQIDGSEEIRQEEWDYVSSLIASRSPSPVIVIGDFNEDVLSSSLFPITGKPSEVKDGVLYSGALSYDSSPTYYFMGKGERLDDAFFNSAIINSERLEVLDSSVLSAQILKDGKEAVRYTVSSGTGYSDHFPIRVVLCYH